VRVAANVIGEFGQPSKERLNLSKQFDPALREAKRTPVKKSYRQSFLQLRDLAADGGLLNAVRYLARSGCYSSMPDDVVKKFEMMNVNSRIIV